MTIAPAPPTHTLKPAAKPPLHITPVLLGHTRYRFVALCPCAQKAGFSPLLDPLQKALSPPDLWSSPPSPILLYSKSSLTRTQDPPFHPHFTLLHSHFKHSATTTITRLRLNTTVFPSGHQLALALKDIPISIFRLLRV